MSYTSTINGTQVSTFPGAYIYFIGHINNPSGANCVPIFRSYSVTGTTDDLFMNDNEYSMYVLPGYKLIVYGDYYSGTSYTIDNTLGTDILLRVSGNKTGSSFKLYFNNVELT